MTKFIPGLKLSELFFEQEVKPIIDIEFPKLKYSAALIGEGSEVLGYDTELSTDHCWGPRVFIFLSEQDFKKLNKTLLSTLNHKLPKMFMGYSTDFDCIHKSKVDIFSIKSYYDKFFKIDPYKNLTVRDWLTIPSQRLLELTSGKVFYDGLNELNKIRNKFNYYSQDAWLYLLSAQWTKIAQEEAFLGRCGDVGDEIGSQVVGARIVRAVMQLSFLMEKKYIPYTKWFGTGFSKLRVAKQLNPILNKAMLSSGWKEREKYLAHAYAIVAKSHNALKITKPLPTEVTSYHDRPYLVIHADSFAAEIKKSIKDKSVQKIATPAGSVDQFIDSTDLLSSPSLCRKLGVIYE